MPAPTSAVRNSLVIHAPASKFKGTGETFEEMLLSGIAKGYIISENQRAQVSVGCYVILLDNEQEKRAEGQLKELEKTEKAGNGQQRYDVYFSKGTPVPYKYERLNRNGVAVI